mmetsp:Transcript_19939/g.53701  ORF Transcript_19939/g.53701 Transcript_19939/m.53701 type:complete len:215 (+) Transcript_19939:1783-2427(+)
MASLGVNRSAPSCMHRSRQGWGWLNTSRMELGMSWTSGMASLNECWGKRSAMVNPSLSAMTRPWPRRPRCPARWAILIQLRRSISCAWRFPRRLSTELTRSLFISRWSCNSSLGAVVHTRALRWSLPGAGPCWRDCATSPVSVRRSLRSAGPRRDTSRPLLGRPRLAGGGCTQCRPRRPHRSHGTDGSEGMSHFTLERRHAWHARRAYGFILIQ